MDILNSDWLIYMLKKAGVTPQARLLSLFDILEDWTNLPDANLQAANLLSASTPNIINTIKSSASKHNALQTYLSLEAAKAGAALPEMLAMQLYVMALSACNEKIQTKQKTDYQTQVIKPILHAKNAAKALIDAQTKKEFRIAKSSAYAIAASFIAVLFVAGSTVLFGQHKIVASTAIAANHSIILPSLASTKYIANPDETMALFAQIEQMRKGTCQLPEALQMPDSYKKVYFQNIVLGQISTDPSEQKLVRELLQKVRCNYTPMLMANSKN